MISIEFQYCWNLWFVACSITACSLLGIIDSTVGFIPHTYCHNSHVSHRIEWAWLGALTSDRVELKMRVKRCSDNQMIRDIATDNIHVLVTQHLEEGQFDDESLVKSFSFHANSVSEFGIAHVVVDNLSSNTEYTYLAWYESFDYNKLNPIDQGKELAIDGRFRTTPLEGLPSNFSFGFASCADNRSNSVIFDVIRKKKPLMFVHTGDLHYGNIEANKISAFHFMYDQVFANPRQSQLFRNIPIVYMFDDHDFGPNNAERNSPSRNASINAFIDAVPCYPLPAYSFDPILYKDNESNGISDSGGKRLNSSVYFAFSIARVRFIVTDTSSSKVSDATHGPTALGVEQLKWLTNELVSAAQNYGLIVWVSTMPWVVTHDKWAVFEEERKIIADTIMRDKIHTKLIMLSGDAHMLAVDDGSNVLGSFPVFQAAALDARPTSKGGPYSHGLKK